MWRSNPSTNSNAIPKNDGLDGSVMWFSTGLALMHKLKQQNEARWSRKLSYCLRENEVSPFSSEETLRCTLSLCRFICLKTFTTKSKKTSSFLNKVTVNLQFGDQVYFFYFFGEKLYHSQKGYLWKSSSSKTEQEIKLLMEKGRSQSISSEETRDVLDVFCLFVF